MDRQDVGGGEKFVLRHIGRAGLFGCFGAEVGAPGDDVHAERLADLCDPAADAAQPQDAQHGAAELAAHGRLPTAATHRYRLVDDPAGGSKDQRPGELDRRLHVSPGGADVNPAFLGGSDVDGGVERPGRGDHLQPRQALDDVSWQWRALTHHAHHVEPLESLDEGVRISDVIVEHGDRGPGGDLRPVSHGQRDILVIVEDRDLHDANLAHQV
jgi:hypothetical protein